MSTECLASHTPTQASKADITTLPPGDVSLGAQNILIFLPFQESEKTQLGGALK